MVAGSSQAFREPWANYCLQSKKIEHLTTVPAITLKHWIFALLLKEVRTKEVQFTFNKKTYRLPISVFFLREDTHQNYKKTKSQIKEWNLQGIR